MLFEKTTSPAIVEINNDDIVSGGSFVEIWLKLTGVKLQGLLNITPKIYLTSDEEKTNLLNIPDTADTYNSNNTLVECQNGTLSVFSLASMLGKATLSDIYVLIDRVDVSNWVSANYTLETTITTPTSSSTFKFEGDLNVIYKYGSNLSYTYTADAYSGEEIHEINVTDDTTTYLPGDSTTQMIKGEAVQQISKRNIILKLGKDFVQSTQLIDYGDTEILFYPQIKITNISLSSELGEAYLFKTRISDTFTYGRDVYLYLFKMQVYGGEFYRFYLSYTPVIVSIYYNYGEGKLVANTGDAEQTIFNCSTTPMESNDTPITSGGVYTALEAKQDVLTFDNAPTQNSNNPVKSGGVYDAIKQAIDDFKWELGTHTIDSETDSDVKYQKIAPVGTFGCEIDKLGGMSYKTKNLFYGYNTSSLAHATDFNYSSDQVISFISTGGDSFVGNVLSSGNTWSDFLGTTYEVKENTTYAYAFFDSNMDKSYYTRLDSNGASTGFTQLNNTSGTFTTLPGTKHITFRFGVGSGVADTTYHCKFMLVEGSTIPTKFEKGFSGIQNSAVTSVVSKDSNNTTLQTLSIPQAIQNLTGYGWGINENCYNYIDYERKVFVQKVGRAILGNMTWAITSNGSYLSNTIANSIKHEISGGVISNLLCSLYTVITASQAYTNSIDMGVGSNESGTVFITNSNYSTAADFKTAMSGVYLYYELATPVETDISQYLTDDDKYIDVEPVGTITFTNTYEQDVPSEITYVTEVAK